MPIARRNFTAIYASHLATAIGMAAFIPFIPYYVGELGVTDGAERKIWAGCIIAAAPAMAAIFGPIWGALGDRVGRKIMVLRSLVAITVFVALMGVVSAPWQMLVLRLFQGVFSGFVAAGNTLVSVSTPVERQGKGSVSIGCGRCDVGCAHRKCQIGTVLVSQTRRIDPDILKFTGE